MTTSVSGTHNGAVDLHPVDPRAVDTSILGDSMSVQDAGAMPQVERMGTAEQVTLFGFIAIPLLAILAAIPVAWNRGLGWHDVLIATVMYAVAGQGITLGFHRYLTRGSFKATRRFQIALAIAGSLTIEGPVIRWAADHRRHHGFSDREGDPHWPWRYGETVPALMMGPWWAHTGWLLDVEQTSRVKYAPDLMADRDVRRVHAAFPALVAVSVLTPAIIGGLWSMSWQGAATAFFWGSLVRIGLRHHVTWSLNSICHPIGERPLPALTSQPMSGGWRSCLWASPGTTCTTPTQPARGVASTVASSTAQPPPSGPSRSWAEPLTSAGRVPNALTTGDASEHRPRHEDLRSDMMTW
jgi:stearoyl-CoA desaturase (delta-9 desaturase)